MARGKRRKLVVNRRFQAAFVLRLVLLELATVFISAMLTAFFIFYILHETTVSAGAWGETFAFNVVLLIAGLLVWVLWRGVVSSHRIAGPAYRLGMALKRVAQGDTSVRITLRQKDELKPLAEEFNRLVESIERRNKQASELLLKAKHELEHQNLGSAKELIEQARTLIAGSSDE